MNYIETSVLIPESPVRLWVLNYLLISGAFCESLRRSVIQRSRSNVSLPPAWENAMDLYSAFVNSLRAIICLGCCVVYEK